LGHQAEEKNMFSKRDFRAVMGIVFLTLSTPAWAQTTNLWNIDPVHSDAHFSVKHMMISNVNGDLGHITGRVEYDGKNLKKASVSASIDASTIDTREPKRDSHLKSSDFLNVDKYPTIVFKSKQVTTSSGNTFKIIGDLTIHGITKEVALEAEIPSAPIKDPFGKTRVGTSATTTINRKDFGITWNKSMDSGGVVVGDEVPVRIELELIKAENANNNTDKNEKSKSNG
jgi:polyisoprenoid-binding protein YceI